MDLTVQIPDELARRLSPVGADLARRTLEALALEGYRAELLTESDIRKLLGFETRMEVHGFLKEHGAFMHYTVEDLDHDSAVALDTARRHQSRQQGEPATELRAG
jgi:Uncharacterised protein family (UPF0175)